MYIAICMIINLDGWVVARSPFTPEWGHSSADSFNGGPTAVVYCYAWNYVPHDQCLKWRSPWPVIILLLIRLMVALWPWLTAMPKMTFPMTSAWNDFPHDQWSYSDDDFHNVQACAELLNSSLLTDLTWHKREAHTFWQRLKKGCTHAVDDLLLSEHFMYTISLLKPSIPACVTIFHQISLWCPSKVKWNKHIHFYQQHIITCMYLINCKLVYQLHAIVVVIRMHIQYTIDIVNYVSGTGNGCIFAH